MRKRTFVYPGSDLDRGKALIAALGTFWSRIYTAKDQLQSYTTAVATLAAQNYRNLLELVAALSRFDVPVFHTQNWVPITIRKSELTSARVVNNFFDVTQQKFDETKTLFDGNADKTMFYFAAPNKLVSLGQIFNRIIYPTVALIENVDYVIDQKSQSIAFIDNPFDNPSFVRRAAAEGDRADEEITLWGFNGKFDYEYVFNQFAYAVGMRLKSSQGYKDLMNAVIDGLISGGATCADLDLAFSAICGIPLTIEPKEKIEVIDTDARGMLIVTDKNAYRFNGQAEPAVTPGQTVRAGSQLIRGFEISELFVGNTYDPLVRNNDQSCCPTNVTTLDAFLTESDEEVLLGDAESQCTPRKKALAALALDRGFLSACFYGDLVFENKNVPLIVDESHPSGFTYVSFQVGGMPNDVKQFFDDIHRAIVKGAVHYWPPDRNPGVGDVWVIPDPKPITVPPIPPEFKENDGAAWTGFEWSNIGVVRGARRSRCADDRPPRCTLAHFLDKRKNPLSEPNASHLPKTVNPLRFIVENVLRNNVFIVKLSVAALGSNRLGLYNVRHLRQLLPPGTAMILVFELEAPLNTIKGAEKIKENTQFFIGAEPAEDTIDETLIKDLGVSVRLLSGSCQ